MSNTKQETISDIVAQLRAAAHIQNADSTRDILKFADRIEAAAKREREAEAEASQICGKIGELIGREAACKDKVTDCNHLGNAAKMRETLERCASMGDQIDSQLGSSEDTVYAFRHERCIAHNISECAREALSATPRNCDVGTVEEQAKRFHSFCESNKQCGDVYSCDRCKLNSIEDCELAWAQMPYEEGGAK